MWNTLFIFIAKVKNYNSNVIENRDSDFKNAFSGILNFTVGILQEDEIQYFYICYHFRRGSFSHVSRNQLKFLFAKQPHRYWWWLLATRWVTLMLVTLSWWSDTVSLILMAKSPFSNRSTAFQTCHQYRKRIASNIPHQHRCRNFFYLLLKKTLEHLNRLYNGWSRFCCQSKFDLLYPLLVTVA